MPTDRRAVSIEGLADLNRAFKVAGSEMTKDLREGMRSAAEPVRSEAESLARSSIKQSAVDWSAMRTGVTQRSVYIAPKQRRKAGGSPRPNLAGKLLGEAMEPALERNIEKVVQEAEDAIRDMSRAWERVG